MSGESEVFKLEKDLCRCCHAEGKFIKLFEPSQHENFCDMLRNCFDINITPVPGNLSDSTYTICPECVIKLKDASTFKKQVQQCEEKFYDMYYKNALFENYKSTSTVKEELDIDNSEDDIHLSELKKSKPKTKMKNKKCKKIKQEEEQCKEVKLKKDIEKPSDYRSSDIRNMVKLIIMFSTATPFRWSYSKYMCFFCDRVFTKFSELKQHHYDHYEIKMDNCLRSINTETKVKFEVSQLSCKICPKDMQTLDDLLDHITITHKQNYNSVVRCSIFAFRLTDTEAPCLQCDQSFTFFGNLLSHVYKNHLNSGQFLCDCCGKGFLTKFMLRKHVKLEHSVTDYVCQKCNMSFKTHGAYSYHRITHKGDFNCSQCPETFSSWYLRKRHIAFVHDKSLQITCELCSKTFVKYNSLKWHVMSVHHNDKPFACDLCDFKCINKTYLKRHMVSHLDTRPYQCHVCVKAFQRKEHLETHVRIHTNDKRYVCKECGKGFVQIAGLKVHLRAHHSKT
ncbi:zinc finger protein 26-like isoform X1 [Colias croceus]|uniref:zinc finger protein 26-like isoform X1 n=2 Tax=Colias crocea TaxID=72248 RepID=UPI001E27DA06|nr:zinc finger protein 26-like isoform X1 [Colias croceus]